MYQLGYDKADNAKSTYGFALESGTGHADYSLGSGKDKLFSGSFYGTWTGDDGSYTDVVAKIGQFDTDIKSYGDYPDKASYKNRAYSVSIEYGKTIELSEKSGTFVEPQLQFIAGRLSSSEYTTDRGNNVYVGGLNSYIGRVGFVAGQKRKRAMMSISRHRRCMNLEAAGISIWKQPMEKPCRCQKTTATRGLK